MTLEELILAFREREKETKGKCFYCETQTEKGVKESNSRFHTKDHVVPQSAKGPHIRANRVVCCRRCNDIKEDLTLHEFKRRSGILIFYAERLIGVRIDDLSDIEAVTVRILNNRKIEGRSVKFNGKPEPRNREVSSLHFQPSCPPLDASPAPVASNE